MKQYRWGLVGLLIGFLAFAAFGDNNVSNHVTHFQNAQTGQKVDANGNQYVNEAAKDRDNYEIDPVCDDTMSIGSFIDSKSSKGYTFTAESSAVFPCAAFRRFTLLIRVVPSVATNVSDTTAKYRLAIQIRKHSDASGDSSSSWAWSAWAPSAVSTTDDSTGHYTAMTSWGGTGSATASTPWSNERVFMFSYLRGNAVAQTFASIPINQSFGWPGGLAIDLQDAHGQWFWGHYISVRIRCLSSGTASAATKPRVIAKLEMGS